MKNWCFVVIIISIFSCAKDEIQTQIDEEKLFSGNQMYGEAEGLRNGELWKASTYALYIEEPYNYYGLFFRTFSIEGFKREDLVFNEIFDDTSKQLIDNKWEDLDGFVGSLYSRLESDGDLLTSVYKLDNEHSQNCFELTQIDSMTISGTFSAKFILETENITYPYPATVEFEDVIFSMQILEEDPE